MYSQRETLAATAALSPESVAGYERIRRVIDSDGALSVAWKALLVAAAASARGYVELARSELDRGRAAGLTDDDLAVGAKSLLLSRGETALARFLEASGPLELATAPAAAGPLDASAYFLGYNDADQLPPRMALLAERAPEVFEGYGQMHRAALSSDPEYDVLAELIMCAINAAELQTGFITIHAASARRRGVSDDQLVECVICAIPVAGVASWAAGSAGLFPAP
jgi:alkylhydroperoxidase/carboxymuconolactone decarboxylase family protein YurZ